MRAPARATVLFALGATAMVACGDDSSSPATTLRPIVTSSVVPATVPATSALPAASIVNVTVAPTETSTATSTSTVVPQSTTTSTTISVGAPLVLRSDGVGEALFGADADEVVGYIRSILGSPTADSGWADPFTSFGVCPGTEVRGVTWGDLTLLFSDDSVVASARRHFFTYNYGPAFAELIDPAGLMTKEGITVGSTVGQLRAAFPLVLVNPGDEIFAPNFYIDDGLSGFLTGTADTDTVSSLTGGIGCGE